MTLEVPYNEEEKEALRHCTLCPRACGVNRLEGEKGFCNCGAGIEISLVCNHKGEEPILVREKGICNVFFAHCNLQCVYCQNKQISLNSAPIVPNYAPINSKSDSCQTAFQSAETADGGSDSPFWKFETLIARIKEVLQESENAIGFVSPTHHLPLMKAILRRLGEENIRPLVIYNTNAYDSVVQLKSLEGIVDVYLPDYKYTCRELSKRLSKAEDYPQRALEAIREMYRQKGSSLLTDSEDRLTGGLLVRHLVLPQQEENTRLCLDNICEISPNIAVSLMSQYAPVEPMTEDFLNQRLTQREYDGITDYFFSRGLHKGFFQELSSQDNYVPDFEKGTWK